MQIRTFVNLFAHVGSDGQEYLTLSFSDGQETLCHFRPTDALIGNVEWVGRVSRRTGAQYVGSKRPCDVTYTRPVAGTSQAVVTAITMAPAEAATPQDAGAMARFRAALAGAAVPAAPVPAAQPADAEPAI